MPATLLLLLAQIDPFLCTDNTYNIENYKYKIIKKTLFV